jgi:hypothetical protein
MSSAPSNRTSGEPSREPTKRFNWPPSDQDLAQYTAVAEQQLRDDVHRLSNGHPHGGKPYAHGICHPGPADAGPMYSATPEQRDALDASAVSSNRVAQLEQISRGGWAAETARVRELIERLTEPIEWRTPSVSGP